MIHAEHWWRRIPEKTGAKTRFSDYKHGTMEMKRNNLRTDQNEPWFDHGFTF
ncbi:MAG: hypothetical protein LIQ31_06440 [Planctomycetes bacterium]|nr:hypothetical protein [Planctomycetota bacterium]